MSIRAILSTLAGLMLAGQAMATELVMVEQFGCYYCERWNEEIGPVYPKTTEGRFAPLRRVEISEIPKDLKIARQVVYTPTFLIIEDNTEIGRLEGYPGEDFFFFVLGNLLKEKAGYTVSEGENG